MEKGGQDGMQTFDQALFEFFKMGKVDISDALNYADSRTNLEWKINFGGGSTSLNKSSKPKKEDEALELGNINFPEAE